MNGACNHIPGGNAEIDLYGWIVIGAMVVYIGIVFRIDLWLLERINWHSDTELDYSNDLFNPNAQAQVAAAAEKEKKEAGDDKDKNQ